MFHKIKNLYHRWRHGAGCCDLYGYYGYISPRLARELKAFKKGLIGHPIDLTFEEWEKIIDEMIWAFEYFGNDDRDETDKDDKRAVKGVELFGKYFTNLWH